MDDLKLEPYAVVIRWQIPEGAVPWENILSEYVHLVAQKCTEAGPCVIGHIKALAKFSGHEYFRISAIDANIPVTIEGSVPAGIQELELTINVLVYGLEIIKIEEIARQTANIVAAERKGGVNFIK